LSEIKGTHELYIDLDSNSLPSLVVVCLNQDDNTRPCFAENLNEENCMVIYCANEVGWDAIEVESDSRIKVGVIDYRTEGFGDEFEDWLVVP
jgi:hypothetical protein